MAKRYHGPGRIAISRSVISFGLPLLLLRSYKQILQLNRAGYLVLHLDLNYISPFNFTKHEQKVQPGDKTKGS